MDLNMHPYYEKPAMGSTPHRESHKVEHEAPQSVLNKVHLVCLEYLQDQRTMLSTK